MANEEPKFSILMFPWLGHGHVVPYLELAKRLTKRNFSIYFCSTSVILDPIQKDLSYYPSIKLIELQIPESSELPPHLHTAKNLPPNLVPILMKTFQESSSSFSNIISSLKPDLLIYDMFQLWAPQLALAQGIPSVCFLTTGATWFCFSHHEYTYGTSSSFPYPEIYYLDVERDDPSIVVASLKDVDNTFAFGNFDLSSDFILTASCREIDGKYVDYLTHLCKKPIVPTGPLLPHANVFDKIEDSEIIKWLSRKNQYSTVYISFGSQCFLSKEQIEEIAKGLELCSANFIWVIRFSVEDETINRENALPRGFTERVKERGIVVWGWAPQASILAHKSIGGFVSHCGWNSTVESLYSGVPVIGMPVKYDQPLTCRLMVEIGVGIEVVKDKNGKFSGEDVANDIDKVISDKEFG